MTPKIVFFGEFPPYSYNGISRANSRLIRELRKDGFVCECIIDYRGNKTLKGCIILLIGLFAYARSLFIDDQTIGYFVYSQGALGQFKTLFLALTTVLLRRRYIVHFHRGDLIDNCRKNPIFTWILAVVTQKASLLCFICASQMNETTAACSYIRSKSIVVSNRLDHLTSIQQSPHIDPAKPVRLLFVGPISCTKGVDVLLDAIPGLEELSVEIEVCFAGEPVDDRLANRIRALVKASSSYRFIDSPSFSRIPSLLSANHVLILPSKTEGLPYLIAEALASSMVVVSTQVGYVSEFLGISYPYYCEASPGSICVTVELITSQADTSRELIASLREALMSKVLSADIRCLTGYLRSLEATVN